MDSEPAVRKQNVEPIVLIQMPDSEDGVQSRPSKNIPIVEPVYDQNSEERQKEFIKFENEIAEEDTTTIAPVTQTSKHFYIKFLYRFFS